MAWSFITYINPKTEEGLNGVHVFRITPSICKTSINLGLGTRVTIFACVSTEEKLWPNYLSLESGTPRLRSTDVRRMKMPPEGREQSVLTSLSLSTLFQLLQHSTPFFSSIHPPCLFTGRPHTLYQLSTYQHTLTTASWVGTILPLHGYMGSLCW